MRKTMIALLLVLALCACSAQSAPAAPPASVAENSGPAGAAAPSAEAAAAKDFNGIYRIYGDLRFEADSKLLLDDDGVLRDRGYDYTVLRDLFTNEPAYYTRERLVPTGEYEEWGEPIAVRESALYSLDGETLIDWSPYSYTAGIGGLVTRMKGNRWMFDAASLEEADASLFDPVSGEVRVKDAALLDRLDAHTAVAYNALGELLGTLDENGNIVAGFPAPEGISLSSIGDGRVIATVPGADWGGDQQWLLLDRELVLDDVVECRYFSAGIEAYRGPYAMLTFADDSHGVYDLERNELLLTVDHDFIDYFDGERLILRADIGNEYRYILCDTDFNTLAGPFSQLWPCGGEAGRTPAESFIAEDGESIVRIGRSGETLASLKVGEIEYVNVWSNGSILYTKHWQESPYPFMEYYYMVALDEDLNPIVPENLYTGLYPIYSDEGGSYNPTQRWMGYRQLPSGRTVIDLLRADGTPIITSLAAVGDASEDAIAVVRGQNVGLIDFDGNWLHKSSVYTMGLSD